MCIIASYFNYRFFADHFLLYASQGRNAAGLDGCNPRRTLEYVLADFEKFHVKYDELRILRTPARQPYKNTRPMAVLLRMAGTQEPDRMGIDPCRPSDWVYRARTDGFAAIPDRFCDAFPASLPPKRLSTRRAPDRVPPAV